MRQANRPSNYLESRLRLASLALLVLAALSCGVNLGSDDSLKETQMALGIQQTMLAQQSVPDVNATNTAQQATIDAQAALATSAAPVVLEPTPDLLATQIAQATLVSAQTPVVPPPPQVTEPPPPVDLDAMMQSASILLYEDIVNDPSVYRFVEKTLKSMGLNYKDDGSAKGWLKSDLLGGAPGGKPWDLVILAIEARGQVTGEYFEYLMNVLNQGSSVILEAYHLDDVSEGAVSPILAKCGVIVYPYFPETGTINDAVMWPLGVPHPVLSEPNSGMTFTRANDFWFWSFDLGSKMALTGNGDAALLVGTDATEKFQDGTLAVCMNGQLTMQTFSSHTFPQDVMMLMWENYIYNALRTRFMGGS
jgi:hypothetical protein